MKKINFLIIVLLFVSLPALPQNHTGRFVARGKYFSLYAEPELGISDILDKLNFKFFANTDDIFDKKDQSLPSVLARTLDAVYLEVCDILDIHVYDFKGNIYFVAGKDEIESVAEKHKIFNFRQPSFYVHSSASIYVSFRDLTLGMLGHEMGHALISHYFVVPPPAKVQEVLCGYIEYNLRKKSKTLP